MLSYHVTTGAFDFHIMIETTDTEALMAALIVAGASGSESNLQTVQAFDASAFTATQKRAGMMAGSFKGANG